VIIAGDALTVHVDPAKAALEGVDAQAVQDQLNGYLSGRPGSYSRREFAG